MDTPYELENLRRSIACCRPTLALDREGALAVAGRLQRAQREWDELRAKPEEREAFD